MRRHYNISWLTERFESGETLQFFNFWGHTKEYNETIGKFCLSQWYESPFTVNARVYKTSEHWMMAHKALLFGDRYNFEKIITCGTPKEAKEFGRQVIGYDEHIWNENKFDIVKYGNIHKFNQHPDFAQYLLKTGEKVLVEASPVDTIWGIGLSVDSKYIDNIYAWRGDNLLGFVLMETRDFFKDFGHFKPLENSIQPPWVTFPDIGSYDMFWRMGLGEEYIIRFSKYFMLLNERDKKIYELTHPVPNEWAGFFE